MLILAPSRNNILSSIWHMIVYRMKIRSIKSRLYKKFKCCWEDDSLFLERKSKDDFTRWDQLYKNFYTFVVVNHWWGATNFMLIRYNKWLDFDAILNILGYFLTDEVFNVNETECRKDRRFITALCIGMLATLVWANIQNFYSCVWATQYSYYRPLLTIF